MSIIGITGNFIFEICSNICNSYYQNICFTVFSVEKGLDGKFSDKV